jgi:hypothetical protein
MAPGQHFDNAYFFFHNIIQSKHFRQRKEGPQSFVEALMTAFRYLFMTGQSPTFSRGSPDEHEHDCDLYRQTFAFL